MENRPASVMVGGQTTAFYYDADGRRVKTTRADGTKVYTPFPEYEKTVPVTGSSTERNHYYLAGQLVAVRVKVAGQTGAFYYFYTDRQGSVHALRKADGTWVNGNYARYDAYGGYRTTPAATVNPGISDRGYTGHRMNNTGNDLGLIYMNARYYLPEVGRFISPDTIVPDPSNPQSYNRYSYGFNNPVKYTDPSGHCVTNDQEITRGDAYDCTTDEMAELTWETRKWWMEMFMRDTGVDWFYNILGILDYFAGDAQFSPLDGWASLSDAGVLIAIQDGWRQYREASAINTSSGALAASAEWTKFFEYRRQFGEDDPRVASQWGVAEQAGVDFGIDIADPLKSESDVATQIEIDTFVAAGDFYRLIISDQAALAVNVAIFNPRSQWSRVFVNAFSNSIVSPAASVLWGQYLAGPGPYFGHGYSPY